MANKVLKFSSSETSKDKTDWSSEDKNIVYKDVSMFAGVSDFATVKHQDRSTYEAYLRQELKTDIDADQYIICDEHNRENLTLYYQNPEDREETERINDMMSKWKVTSNVNVLAVQQSLRNIFTWIQGERILLPEFGSKLRQYLYEGITPFNTEKIVAEIKHCVSIWEPRVQVLEVINVSTINDVDDNTTHLEVIYTIPGLSKDQYSYRYDYSSK